jgi:hypothetical protein
MLIKHLVVLLIFSTNFISCSHHKQAKIVGGESVEIFDNTKTESIVIVFKIKPALNYDEKEFFNHLYDVYDENVFVFDISVENNPNFFKGNVYTLGTSEPLGKEITKQNNGLQISLLGLSQDSFIPGHYIEKSNVQTVYFANNVKKNKTDIAMVMVNDLNLKKKIKKYFKIIPEKSVDIIIVPSTKNKVVQKLKNGILMIEIPQNETIHPYLEIKFVRTKDNKLLLLGN